MLQRQNTLSALEDKLQSVDGVIGPAVDVAQHAAGLKRVLGDEIDASDDSPGKGVAHRRASGQVEVVEGVDVLGLFGRYDQAGDAFTWLKFEGPVGAVVTTVPGSPLVTVPKC